MLLKGTPSADHGWAGCLPNFHQAFHMQQIRCCRLQNHISDEYFIYSIPEAIFIRVQIRLYACAIELQVTIPNSIVHACILLDLNASKALFFRALASKEKLIHNSYKAYS